ncbi:MAG: hypothetical protein ACQEUM_07265 [Pseudomonadota bacterium]
MDPNKIALDDAELTPQFLNEEERSLFAQAELGEQAVTFLDSELGRFMRGCAIQRRREAQEILLQPATDPETAEGRAKIREARFQAAVADQFLEFIREAVTTGEVAYQSLKQMRDQA